MCITDAFAYVRQDCPFKKSAAIWFDECFHRYSENAFFHEIDKQESFIVSNTQNASLSLQITQLMSSLRKERSCKDWLSVIDRDLSSEDCDKCLESLAALLADGTRGGKVANRN
ncbi:cysteine-rich repeat secretory protein 38-like [Asparagus officinalis]|uniref:cysteine-rich repeat secretory protein 38-like n=1 Tax=Asparagus officinalis TaxID=4686 RepID=UPI00098E290A|nr:cysteine-rich repeat secretory protein 38-like [Asparagus officinalis]